MSLVINGMPAGGPPSRRKGAGCLVGTALFTLVMVIPFVAVLVAVWPGVLGVTAPVVCPDGFDDTVIARDTYNPRPGETSTTFTMYCINERGELTDEGAFGPAAIVTAVLMGVVLVVMVLLALVVGVRGRRRGDGTGASAPPGQFDLSTIGGAGGHAAPFPPVTWPGGTSVPPSPGSPPPLPPAPGGPPRPPSTPLG